MTAAAVSLRDPPRALSPAPDVRGEVVEQLRVLERAGLGIALIQRRCITSANQRLAELYGHAQASLLVGRSTRHLFASDEDFHALGPTAYAAMASGQPFKTEVRQRQRDGTTFWARLTGSLFDPADPAQGAVWIVENIDAQKTAEVALVAAREQQQLIVDSAMVGIVIMRGRQVQKCNRAFEEMLGYAPGELDGVSARCWYQSDADYEAAGQRCHEPFARGSSFEGELSWRHRRGHAILCVVRSRAIEPAHPERGTIWIALDITKRKATERALIKARLGLERQVAERTDELARTVHALEQKVAEHRAAEARIARMAHYDALTGLPNRALLEARCREALANARRGGGSAALLFLDLDHFKTVNDSLGHRVGDAVLIELAKRLSACVRGHDTVSRLGGDEFVLLLPDADIAGAQAAASRVLASAQEPFRIDGHELTVTPSLGIALAPRDGDTLDALSRAADAAMYLAKAEGRNTWRCYSSELQAQSERTLLLSNALRRAIEREQLSLVFQPQMDLASGRIFGAEALLRWRHAGFGNVSPAEFIPIAESTGLILPIGEWVLEAAVRQIAAWDREGLPALTVAVNVSSVQLRQPDLPALLRRTVDGAGLGMHRLEVELTEGAAMQDPQAAIAIMNTLYENGTELSIDDFGTGYSSLAYLKHFPVSKLKIDRSFVSDIGSDVGDRAIVEAIIRMAASLGMRTVAEGVETEEQLAFLRGRGCDAMQGYLLSKPLAADEFARFVRSRNQEG